MYIELATGDTEDTTRSSLLSSRIHS